MNKILEKQAPAASQPLAALFDPENPACRMLDRVIRHREAAERSWHRNYFELLRVRDFRLMKEIAAPLISAPPERTQSQAPLQSVPRPAPPENLALRL